MKLCLVPRCLPNLGALQYGSQRGPIGALRKSRISHVFFPGSRPRYSLCSFSGSGAQHENYDGCLVDGGFTFSLPLDRLWRTYRLAMPAAVGLLSVTEDDQSMEMARANKNPGRSKSLAFLNAVSVLLILQRRCK